MEAIRGRDLVEALAKVALHPSRAELGGAELAESERPQGRWGKALDETADALAQRQVLDPLLLRYAFDYQRIVLGPHVGVVPRLLSDRRYREQGDARLRLPLQGPHDAHEVLAEEVGVRPLGQALRGHVAERRLEAEGGVDVVRAD